MTGSMYGPLAFIVGLVLAVLLVAALRRRRSAVDAYVSKRPLSEPEQTLFWRLREAMPECVVLSQVTFSRFLEPTGATTSRRQLFNRIAQKSVDFLVCLPDFTLVAAVELDDSSHRATRDARRDAILMAAGVPLVRLHVREMPSAVQLRAMFLQ